VPAINKRLRRIGVTEAQLHVGREEDSLTVAGSLADVGPSLPQLFGGPPQDVRHVIYSEEGLFKLLDRLVPQWRKVDPAA
jgi:hypothetical protein